MARSSAGISKDGANPRPQPSEPEPQRDEAPAEPNVEGLDEGQLDPEPLPVVNMEELHLGAVHDCLMVFIGDYSG